MCTSMQAYNMNSINGCAHTVVYNARNKDQELVSQSFQKDRILYRLYFATVEPVYYGHIRNNQKRQISRCPDFPGHSL